MKMTKGFTLIELIVTIVILGILAAYAAPKYLNFRKDARIATLKGMQGALSGASDLVYSKAILSGQTQNSGAITTQTGESITVDGGYPIGTWQDSLSKIITNVSAVSPADPATKCNAEWCGIGDQPSFPSGITPAPVSPVVLGKVFPKGYSSNDHCGVYFINLLDGTKPLIGIESDGC